MGTTCACFQAGTSRSSSALERELDTGIVRPGNGRNPTHRRDRDRAVARPYRAEEAEARGSAGQAADPHERSGVRRLDDVVVACVDRNVTGAIGLRLEEHEV